jgi:hypothetical protein
MIGWLQSVRDAVGGKEPEDEGPNCSLADLAGCVCEPEGQEAAGGRSESQQRERRKALIESRRVFARKHGGIIDEYFGCKADVAVILTDRDELWIDTSRSAAMSRCPDADDLIHQAYRRRIVAYRLLRGQERRIVMQDIFSLARCVLASVEHWWVTDPQRTDDEKLKAEERLNVALEAGKKTLAMIEEDQLEMTRRQTQRRYVVSLLAAALCFLVVPLAFSALGYGAGETSVQGGNGIIGIGESVVQGGNGNIGVFDNPTWGPLWLCGVAGALGATVSLLLRLGNGGLAALDGFAPRWQAVLLGAGRAFLGVVFGVALFAFIEAGLLPIEVPNDSNDSSNGTLSTLGAEFFFIAALGFIAGFSERLVPDALAVSEGKLLGGVHKAERQTSSSSTGQKGRRNAAEVDRERADGQRGSSDADVSGVGVNGSKNVGNADMVYQVKSKTVGGRAKAAATRQRNAALLTETKGAES